MPKLSRRLCSLAFVSFLACLPAAATCGSAACFLVTETTEGLAAPHALRVDFSVRLVDQDRKLSGTESIDEVLTPKIDFETRTIELDHHREIRTVTTLAQLDLVYGLTPRLSLLTSIPLFVDKQHEHFDDVGTPDEAFTNQDGTSGFGDLQLGARYGFVLDPKTLLAGSLALKLPTAPYRLFDSEGAINEPTIQPGTGSYDWLASIGFSRQVHEWKIEWFAGGALRRNGENELDYRIGDEYVVNAGARFEIEDTVELSFQVNGKEGGRDRYLGSDVPSTGATTVYATPGIRFGKETSFYAFVQLPVYEKVHESQIAPRTGYVLGMSRTF